MVPELHYVSVYVNVYIKVRCAALPVVFLRPLVTHLAQRSRSVTSMPHSAISQMLRPATSFGLPVNGSRTGAFRAVRASGLVSATSTARRGNPVRQPRDENVAGNFYVDHTCIGTLRQEPWLPLPGCA